MILRIGSKLLHYKREKQTDNYFIYRTRDRIKTENDIRINTLHTVL